MSRFISVWRFLSLGAAFVGVMAFAGGLFGAVGGMILALLTRALMNLNGDIYGLVALCGGLGAAGLFILGIALIAPHAPRLSIGANAVQAIPAINAVPANSETN